MNTMDYMLSLANQKVEKVDKDYLKLEQEFINTFGHIVPREMLPSSVSKEDLMKAIKICIETKNDNIFDVLGVEINLEHMY